MASTFHRKQTKAKVKKSAINEQDLAFMGSREEAATNRSIASRQRLHDQLADDVAKFLAKGGKIDCIKHDVIADPPKRPVSHYGQRPI